MKKPSTPNLKQEILYIKFETRNTLHFTLDFKPGKCIHVYRFTSINSPSQKSVIAIENRHNTAFSFGIKKFGRGNKLIINFPKLPKVLQNFPKFPQTLQNSQSFSKLFKALQKLFKSSSKAHQKLFKALQSSKSSTNLFKALQSSPKIFKAQPKLSKPFQSC